MTQASFELSIITVTYKCRDVFHSALASILNSKTSFNFEVIIIDNDSQDGTVQMVETKFLTQAKYKEQIQLIQNTNEGFPKANNRGLAVRRGKYVLFLNPDTLVEPNTLEVMMSFMKTHPDVGISTCKLIKKNGELDYACRRTFPTPWVAFARLIGLAKLFPKSRWFAKYNLTYLSVNQATPIDACVGAFMFISEECIRAVKGFDERFYMYGEDLDLCLRAKALGFKIWYWPNAVTVHYKGESSKKNPKVIKAFYSAMWLFYKKHYSRKYLYILDPFVWLGVWSLYGLKLSTNLFKKQVL